MTFVAKKAKRTRRPLKVSAEGTAGSGKTFTMIRMAYDMKRNGIGKNIVVFDTENESAALYAGQTVDGERWDFMHVDMPADKRNPAGFAEAYEWAVSQGYDIIIFDSLSHAWHGALELVDQMSRGGDKMRAWASMSPQQRQMIQVLTDPRAHCLVTMRVKTDFQEVEGANGKKRMQKVGLKADQRENTEYEFDLVLRFEAGNDCYVDKVRGCSEMNGKNVSKPGPAFWKPLLEWWRSAEEKTHAQQQQPAQQSPAGILDVTDIIKQIMATQTAEEKRTLMAVVGVHAKNGAVAEDDLKRVRATGFVMDLKFATDEEAVGKVMEAAVKASVDGKVTAEQLAKIEAAGGKRVNELRDANG